MNAVKVKILEDTFNKSFDLEQFKRFTKEFFNEPEMFPNQRKTGIWKEYTEHIFSYYKIANYTDINDNKLIVLAVEIKKDKSVERARTMQRNFISKVLDENGFEAAIVAFYNPTELNWRLSFVRLDYSFTDKGLELDITPARRYSYLVGESEPNHTAKAQLLPIFENDTVNPTIDEIEEAFTVEKVTKEFFEQYKEKYIQLKEYLEQDASFIEETEKLGFEVGKFAEQFSKKLLGQLAFLYFLQKKGWLGVRILPKERILLENDYQQIYSQQDVAHQKILDSVFEIVDHTKRRIVASKLVELNEHEAELFSDCFINTEHEEEWGAGDKRFISKLFETCKKNKTRNNFFHDFLQPLFYEALNHKRKNHYFNKFNCKVPFLNGGLFEPLEGYHWRDVHFNIPNSLFSNSEEKGRKADGILDIFERYNFTMNEDEPLEKEVAVDPEMLGKIFENLLDVKDRKSKGAFYTPREIVHYMCQESLANYLSNEVGVPYEDMKEFILYGDLIRDTDSRSGVGYNNKELSIKPTIYNNLVKIDKALENVKVADPAVGSGAFPLGMLSEIVKARNNITDYLVILDNRGMLGRKFGEDIIRKARSPFELKWKTIKNSIFAVDIEPSAVDIAKLRLWLSVVVDQEINKETPEPQPLPNLDMNIMVGNSLIDEYEGIRLFDESVLKKKHDLVKEDNSEYSITTEQLSLLVDYSEDMLQEMFRLQDQYFGERNEQNKKDIKERIDELRDELIEYKLERDGNKVGLKKYIELKKKKQKPYFLWYLEFAKVFQDRGGFDIVIANPPYIGEIGNKDIFRPIARTNFGKKYYKDKMDIFYFFFHLANDISKNNSIISFITTNYFLSADGASTLRNDIKVRNTVLKLINFNELKIFESAKGQHNIITILEKGANSDFEAKCCQTYKTGFASQSDITNIINWNDKETLYINLSQDDLFDEYGNIVLLNNKDDTIIKKMDEYSNYKLSNKDIGNGIDILQENVTPKHMNVLPNLKKGEGIFAITDSELKSMNLTKDEMNIIKPYYTSEQIPEYSIYGENKKWIIYTNKQAVQNINNYKNIKAHLDRFSAIITSDNKPYGLHRAREESLFKGEKILSLRMTKKQKFSFANKDTYVTRAYLIIKPSDPDINLKYLTALLNSKLFYYWFYQKGKRKGQQLQIDKTPLCNAPLILASENEMMLIIEIVNNIITNVEKYGPKYDYKNEAEKLDSLIYKLYKLNEHEISIVEKFYQKNYLLGTIED